MDCLLYLDECSVWIQLFCIYDSDRIIVHTASSVRLLLDNIKKPRGWGRSQYLLGL